MLAADLVLVPIRGVYGLGSEAVGLTANVAADKLERAGQDTLADGLRFVAPRSHFYEAVEKGTPDAGAVAQEAQALGALATRGGRLSSAAGRLFGTDASKVEFEVVPRSHFEKVFTHTDRGKAMALRPGPSGLVAPSLATRADSKAGRAAANAGLVFARPSLTEARSSVIQMNKDLPSRAKLRVPQSLPVGTVSPGSVAETRNFLRNRQVAKAVMDAEKAGLYGEEAKKFIDSKYPESVAKQIEVPEKGFAPGEVKAKPTGGRAPKVDKLVKTSGSVVKQLPLIGTAFDAANVYDEFTDPNSTNLEKAAAIGDLALGLTGAPLVLDLLAGASGHDGFFAMMVGDKD